MASDTSRYVQLLEKAKNLPPDEAKAIYQQIILDSELSFLPPPQ